MFIQFVLLLIGSPFFLQPPTPKKWKSNWTFLRFLLLIYNKKKYKTWRENWFQKMRLRVWSNSHHHEQRNWHSLLDKDTLLLLSLLFLVNESFSVQWYTSTRRGSWSRTLTLKKWRFCIALSGCFIPSPKRMGWTALSIRANLESTMRTSSTV